MSKLGWILVGLLAGSLAALAFWPAPSPTYQFRATLRQVLYARHIDPDSAPAVQAQLSALGDEIAANPVDRAAVLAAARGAYSLLDLRPVLDQIQARSAQLQEVGS